MTAPPDAVAAWRRAGDSPPGEPVAGPRLSAGRGSGWRGLSPDPTIRFLLLLLGLTLVRGIVYAILNPPFGSPDEVDHFQYIASLATDGTAGPRGREGHQPIGYYALMVPAYWLSEGYPAPVQLLVIRLASLPLLLGQVVFTWLAARGLAPGNPLVPALAATFVALLPANTLIAASANNDNVANLMGALLTYLLVSLVRGSGWWLIPATGLALGGAVLAKGQLLPMAGLVGLVLLGQVAWRVGAARSGKLLLWLIPLVIIAALAVTVRESFYLVQRSQWVLAILGRWPEMVEVTRDYGWYPFLYQFTSFWAAFLGESVRPAAFWYLLPTSVVALGAAGYLARIRSGVLDVVRRPPRSGALVRGVLVLMLVLQWIPVYLIFIQHALSPDFPYKIQYMQGRYLFPMLAPLALLVGEGWSLFARERGWGGGYLIAVVALLLLFDAAALGSLLGYYSWSP